MAADGKMQALNTAVREMLPHLRDVAAQNPHVELLFSVAVVLDRRALARRAPTPSTTSVWKDLDPGGYTDLGAALDSRSPSARSVAADRGAGAAAGDRARLRRQPTDDFDRGLAPFLDEPFGQAAVADRGRHRPRRRPRGAVAVPGRRRAGAGPQPRAAGADDPAGRRPPSPGRASEVAVPTLGRPGAVVDLGLRAGRGGVVMARSTSLGVRHRQRARLLAPGERRAQPGRGRQLRDRRRRGRGGRRRSRRRALRPQRDRVVDRRRRRPARCRRELLRGNGDLA